jgi:predicted TIM-barrel fold metal-dependent hydrolase
MTLIDTHLHLIARDRFGYGWTAGIPPLAEGSFLIEDAMALAGRRIAGFVFMEAAVDDAHYQDEARWVHGLMAGQPALLGQIAACHPETDEGFAAWLEEGAGLGVVGYRRVLHVVDDGMSQTETFRANVRRIGRAGRVFDICMLGRQLPIALDLVRACPEVSFVLDHCGVPDVAGGGLDPWRAGITALAAMPNVTCKLSGITAYAGADQDRAAAIRPFVDHVLAAFGPARMVWGSDWPVVNLGSGLPGWLEITGTILAGLSADEQADLSHRTARRVYGLAPG